MELIKVILIEHPIILKAIIVAIGYLFTFWIANVLIKRIVLKGKRNFDADGNGKIDEKDEKIIRDGFIIGKCENIIILSFVLAGEVTGLALIFAAKSLARQKDINDNAGFFLAGTMVNFTATLVLAFVLKYIITSLSWA